MIDKKDLEQKISDIWLGATTYKMRDLVESLGIFLESHICLLKGANRHPDADVLHEFIEQGGELQYKDENEKWWTYVSLEHTGYRIKPFEPIYEWKYEIQTQGMLLHTAFHYTDDEAIIAVQQKYQYFEKMEETKQIRIRK